MPKYANFARTLGSASFFSSRSAAAFAHLLVVFARRPALERFFGVEKDCDRPFIHQLHGHHRLKNSSRNADAEILNRQRKLFVKLLGLLGRSSGDETWAALTARIAVKRKLRNDEGRTAHFQQRAIHFPLIVLKNAEVCHLLCHRGSNRRSVLAADAEQNHHPGADFARNASFDRHARTAHPLHYGPHRIFLFASLPRQLSRQRKRCTTPRGPLALWAEITTAAGDNRASNHRAAAVAALALAPVSLMVLLIFAWLALGIKKIGN